MRRVLLLLLLLLCSSAHASDGDPQEVRAHAAAAAKADPVSSRRILSARLCGLSGGRQRVVDRGEATYGTVPLLDFLIEFTKQQLAGANLAPIPCSDRAVRIAMACTRKLTDLVGELPLNCGDPKSLEADRWMPLPDVRESTVPFQPRPANYPYPIWPDYTKP